VPQEAPHHQTAQSARLEGAEEDEETTAGAEGGEAEAETETAVLGTLRFQSSKETQTE
jgi:hypothetical protein